MKFWLIVYRWAMAVLVVLLIIISISFFLPKVRQNRDYRRLLTNLEEDNRVREEMVQRLQQQQERFANDPRFVERIAREELGKAMPGEKIFRFTNTNEPTRRMSP